VIAHGRGRKLQTRMAESHRWSLLDRHAVAWARRRFPTGGPDVAALRDCLSASFTGFSLMPPHKGGSRAWLFAGEGLAGILRACECLHLPPDAVYWDVPLLLVGHLVASKAAANGDPVERPRDPADIRLQLRLSNLRHAAGVLDPWQIEHPERHDLSAVQKSANPALVDLHALLKDEK
jgi:hypothetical protein